MLANRFADSRLEISVPFSGKFVYSFVDGFACNGGVNRKQIVHPVLPLAVCNLRVGIGNGALYLAEWAGQDGSTLGTDEVWLDTVEEQDGVVTLTLTAYGAAASWGYDEDEYASFTVKLARTPDGLRVDEAGVPENGYLSGFTVTEKPE